MLNIAKAVSLATCIVMLFKCQTHQAARLEVLLRSPQQACSRNVLLKNAICQSYLLQNVVQLCQVLLLCKAPTMCSLYSRALFDGSAAKTADAQLCDL